MGSLDERVIIGCIMPFLHSIILQYEENFQYFCLSIMFFIGWAKHLNFKFITSIQLFLHMAARINF